MTVTVISRPTGHPGYSETFPCVAESVRAARRLVRIALAAWGVDHIAGDGMVIVSELVTNAVQHTECDHVRVTVSRPSQALVRISVSDRSRGLPLPGEPDHGDVHGRGLALVDALSEHWGTDLTRWGKSVWAELWTEAGSAPVRDG